MLKIYVDIYHGTAQIRNVSISEDNNGETLLMSPRKPSRELSLPVPTHTTPQRREPKRLYLKSPNPHARVPKPVIIQSRDHIVTPHLDRFLILSMYAIAIFTIRISHDD
jgi:hypothetical protein